MSEFIGNLTRHDELFLGYHACSEKSALSLTSSNSIIIPSNQKHDWLGNGFYVWENNLERAREFAEEKKARVKSLEDWLVVGVIYTLGNCLDTTTTAGLKLINFGYNSLLIALNEANEPIPTNKPAAKSGDDLVLRYADCAVINYLHKWMQKPESGYLAPFDTVRGVFWEGEPIYPNAGFRQKNHIQICIRNLGNLKGFFWPRF